MTASVLHVTSSSLFLSQPVFLLSHLSPPRFSVHLSSKASQFLPFNLLDSPSSFLSIYLSLHSLFRLPRSVSFFSLYLLYLRFSRLLLIWGGDGGGVLQHRETLPGGFSLWERSNLNADGNIYWGFYSNMQLNCIIPNKRLLLKPILVFSKLVYLIKGGRLNAVKIRKRITKFPVQMLQRRTESLCCWLLLGELFVWDFFFLPSFLPSLIPFFPLSFLIFSPSALYFLSSFPLCHYVLPFTSHLPSSSLFPLIVEGFH